MHYNACHIDSNISIYKDVRLNRSILKVNIDFLDRLIVESMFEKIQNNITVYIKVVRNNFSVTNVYVKNNSFILFENKLTK